MNTLDKQYIDLLQDILDNGVTKQDRTGTGTLSVFGRQIRHKMSDGFPLLTTKKMPFRLIATELMWFLRGDTNIKFLVDNDCHIWDGDAYQFYLKECEKSIEADRPVFELDDKYIIVQTYNNGLPELKENEILYKYSDNRGYIGRKYIKEEFINKIKTDVEFAKKWGELGPVYGKQWRSWEHNTGDTWTGMKHNQSIKTKIDQITNLINDLKTNPDSRRLMVNAWNVGEIDQMTLPPCHYGFQVYTRELSLKERVEMIQPFGMDALIPDAREKWMEENNIPKRAISLMWNQRSCDVPLGIPMNISSYALLLMMIADEVNMVPDELIGNLGDCHIYLNQMEGVKEQIGREPYPLPKVSVRDGIFCSSVNDVILENYQSHPKIYFPLSN
jgi:thymidylate synthase